MKTMIQSAATLAVTITLLVVVGRSLVQQHIVAKDMPPTSQPAKAPVMEVLIDNPKITVGEAFAFKVQFKNPNDQPMVIVAPLDGSAVGWRFANYAWSALDQNDNPVGPRGYGRCGNVNGLQETDFVTLEGGKSVDIQPGFLSPPTLLLNLQPGKYRLMLTYTCDPDKKESGLEMGQPDRKTLKLKHSAWTGSITSKPVEIEVVAK